MSKVTAVIPCYNAAAFVTEAIGSVRAQTVPVAEIVVVNDGSLDASAEVARGRGATVLSTGGRRGPATARNLGVERVRTPYIAFLDADDVWLPRHCETLMDLLERSPRAAVAFGRIQRFDARGDVPTPRRAGIRHEGSLPELLLDNPIAQSAAMVRTAMFLEVGGYRDGGRYSEDYDLWLRLAERFEIVASEQVTCRYRLHPNQDTNALVPMFRSTWTSRFASRDRLRAANAYSPEHEAMLLEALEDDIRTAWTMADREALLELQNLVPRLAGGERFRRPIRTRMRWAGVRRFLLGLRAMGKRWPWIEQR